METEKLYATFHIGRGGRFHNQGHKSFYEFCDFQELIRKKMDYLYPIEDNDGNVIGGYTDCSGNEVVDADDANSLTGTMDFDGEYDTYITKEINDCDSNELELVADKINLIDHPSDYKSLLKALDDNYEFYTNYDEDKLLNIYMGGKYDYEMPNIKAYLIKWEYIDEDGRRIDD